MLLAKHHWTLLLIQITQMPPQKPPTSSANTAAKEGDVES